MFAAKKIISAFIVIPGLFITILLIAGLVCARRKNPAWKPLLAVALLLYLFSVGPVANTLIGAVEMHALYNGKERADVIVLLGGGIHDGVPDLTGSNIPGADAMYRVVEAARLYKLYCLPVIVSGGAVGCDAPEAPVDGRFLADLDVDRNSIICDTRSRDTGENAEFVREICTQRGFKRCVLVTSAYHMRRAEYIFKEAGIESLPHTCGAYAESQKCLDYLDLLPHIAQLRKSSLALRELIGSAYYCMASATR